MDMDEVDRLNSFMSDHYKPEQLLIEAPKKEDPIGNAADRAIIKNAVEKEVEKYKSVGSSSSSTSSPSSSSPYKPYQSGSSSSSSSPYGSTVKSPVEEVMDRFKIIQNKAYDEAEKEMKSENSSTSKYNINPQLKAIKNRGKNSFGDKVKNIFNSKRLQQIGLIISILTAKTISTFVQEEYKEAIKKAREKK